MLWSVSSGELSLDAMLLAKFWKLMWIIFTSTIWPDHFNEVSRLLLSERLEFFEPREGLWFVHEETNPYFPTKIINKGQEIKKLLFLVVFSTYLPVFLLKFRSREHVGCVIWFFIQRLPTLHAKVWKLMWIIFTSTIWPEDFNKLLILLLSERLELFEPREGLWFVLEEINLYFPTKIINECQRIKANSYELGLHGSTKVCMNYLKMFFSSRCGSGEVVLLMFPNDTILTRSRLFIYNW